MMQYNQSLRTLYVMDYLLRYTDEKHPCTCAELIAMLEKKDALMGVTIGRKSIYSDISTLGPDGFGLDIISSNGKYYIASRDFELEEVELLLDVVQSANFITEKKSRNLVKKLENLASAHEAKTLNRKIHIFNRVKTQNEKVFYNIASLSRAINSNVAVQFKYFKYDVSKLRKYGRSGGSYTVSPFALFWGEQNYYLLAYSHADRELRHYRIDRIEGITVTGMPREGHEEYGKIDIATYPPKVFYAFRGPEYQVTLRCKNMFSEAVLDRFGRNVMLIPDGDEHFTVTVDILESPQFYAWLTGFGDGVEVVSPAAVRDGMTAHLEKILRQYKAE